ncbi:hypothetical protein [Bacillus sp. 166amftsu]|uniref:hypothetical protein n=1 Tax=Bacillus sp. 166amftsu TaxID=1761753 RepID=UPI0008952767|nr:hypothetical protein [Bacillus sp. 166amftsu]SDY93298.1 hypothetical protein SAMN04488156_10353 [Bacillus sp. 166amftsu]
MKEIIIGVLMSLPTWFWLTYFCGLSGLETLVTAFILGVTFVIYDVVLEITD